MRASWEDAAVDHGVTREGSLRYKLSRALETYVLKRADAITTICHGLARDIAVRGIARERVVIVPNGVDIEQFAVITRQDEELRAELGLGAGPVLGFIGSFYSYEGIDVLLSALPLVLREWPDASIVLAGGGPAERELKALAESLGVSQRVRFVGRVPHERVRRYYSVIDLLAYPRKSMRLTELVTPLKPLEAMALGRMFIASDVGGHSELIPPQLHDRLFAAGDAQALAGVALRLLAARSEWPRIAAEARAFVSSNCTWRVSAAHYKDVYARVAPFAPAARGSHGARAT
jgi:PEP-CTERM/exosortase A-associated glycosyltransferase